VTGDPNLNLQISLCHWVGEKNIHPGHPAIVRDEVEGRSKQQASSFTATSSVKVNFKDIHLPSETTRNRTTTRKNTCESGK